MRNGDIELQVDGSSIDLVSSKDGVYVNMTFTAQEAIVLGKLFQRLGEKHKHKALAELECETFNALAEWEKNEVMLFGRDQT